MEIIGFSIDAHAYVSQEDSTCMAIVLYVSYLITTSGHGKKVGYVKESLNHEFGLPDLGRMLQHIGGRVDR